MMTKKFASYLSGGVAGICFLIAAFLIWQHNTPSRLAFSGAEVGMEHTDIAPDSLPQVLMIPALGVEVPVYPAQVEGNKWETTSKGVSYLVGSSIPGEAGNSVIYGHNWNNILGALPRAEKGQEVLVQYASGEVARFVIEEKMIVTPDQTHILAPTEDTRLTIYTCSGFLDRKRFVVVAVLV